MRFFRLWVRGFGFLGIILGIVFSALLFYHWSLAISHRGGDVNSDVNKLFFIWQNSGFRSPSKILFLFFALWMSVQSLVFSVGLVRYSFLSDADFFANKGALVLFSLSSFTWGAAFALISMPNADVKSTRAADTTIVRYLGTVCYVAPLVIVMSLLSGQQLIARRTGINMNQNQLHAFYAMIGTLVAVGLLVLATTIPFYSKRIDEELYDEQKKLFHHFLWAVVIFYRLLATIQLLILVLVAVVRVLFAFAELFQSRNILSTFFNLFFVVSAVLSAAFLIYLVKNFVQQLGLRNKTHGLVVIKEWKLYTEHQNKKRALKTGNTSSDR